MIHDDHGLSPYAPTHIVWNGETECDFNVFVRKIDEIMSELTEKRRGERYVYRKIKRQNQKVIYVRQGNDGQRTSVRW